MASSDRHLSAMEGKELPDASTFRIGIVVSSYHRNITQALEEGCLDLLQQQQTAFTTVHYAPGAFELPAAAHALYAHYEDKGEPLDAVITLGCVIRGETDHDRYINYSVAQALQQLSITYETPFLFGLLTPNTLEQALARAGGKHGNKGYEVAAAALKMVALRKELKR